MESPNVESDPVPAGPVRPSGPSAVSIVVPTYQEVESLPALIDRIEGLRSVGWTIELLIMDDDSRDGTVELIEARRADWINLVVRTQDRGLSAAVIEGLQRATHEIMVVMDADLSHPPEVIPDFVAALESDADFVVGSRYVSGGSTEDGWGVLRWINSKVATVMARPFTTVRDPMSGFLGIRRGTFAAVEGLDPVGYKIGLELIVKCRCDRVAEVPIHFSTRRFGESKLTLKVQYEYLCHILRLSRWKYPDVSSFLSFAAVGGLGIGVYVALLAALGAALGSRVSHDLIIVVAILLTMCFNFTLDRRLAFWWAPRKQLLRQFLGFMAICTVPVVANFFITRYFSLQDMLATPLAGIIGATAGSVLSLFFNWGCSRLFVFSRSRRAS